MASRINPRKVAHRAFFYMALVIIVNSLGGFDLWHSPMCRAGQTINVSPGQNLQALVNQYPAGTTFSLAAGVYRLQSVVPQNNDSFIGQTGAILSGAALLTTFNQIGAYWTAQVAVTQAASYPGICRPTSPACMYPEDLFFNNVLRIRAPNLAAVGPGSWYLDYSTGTVYMGDNPNGNTVEMSELPYAFTGAAANVTISNLTIEKYACVAQSGAIEGSGGTNWAVGGNEVRYNHGRGISSGNGMYIYNNDIFNNGNMGLGGTGVNVLVQSNQISYNNYAGYSYYWEAGGAKFFGVQNLTVQYNYSHNNSGPGFWNDGNSQYVTYNGNQASGNIEAGILSAISSNITIANNNIWDDGNSPDGSGIWWGAGILISDSTTVSITSNTLSNCMDGIGEILSNRGYGPNGQPYTLQNVMVSGNTIYQTTGFAAGIVVEGSGFDNSVYTRWNNIFQANTYNLADPNGYYFYWLGQPMTLDAFWGIPSGGGSSPNASISPSSLTFGSCPVTEACASQTLTLSNTGTAALSITSITLTGSNPADFTENTTCSSSLAAGGQCTFVILFTPSASGSRSASLSITDNAGGSPQSAPLAGTGSHDVMLSWTGTTAPGMVGYNVYRGTASNGESTTALNSSPVSGTSYTDTNVQAGATYYYVVTAVNSSGANLTAASNEASAAVPSP